MRRILSLFLSLVLLTGLFSSCLTAEPKPSGDKQMTHSEIIEAAQKAYDDAIAAQKKGDWASYGKHMKELEKYLNMLK